MDNECKHERVRDTGVCVDCNVAVDPLLSHSELDTKAYEAMEAIISIAESLKTIADCLEERRN